MPLRYGLSWKTTDPTPHPPLFSVTWHHEKRWDPPHPHGVLHSVTPFPSLNCSTCSTSLIWNIVCTPSSPIFLEQKSLLLDLLISFIKSFKTLDFSKHVSHVTTLCYDITLENNLKYTIIRKIQVSYYI